MSSPAPRYNPPGVHWDDCWRFHHDCAIARIEARQRVTVDDVDRALAAFYGSQVFLEWRPPLFAHVRRRMRAVLIDYATRAASR